MVYEQCTQDEAFEYLDQGREVETRSGPAGAWIPIVSDAGRLRYTDMPFGDVSVDAARQFRVKTIQTLTAVEARRHLALNGRVRSEMGAEWCMSKDGAFSVDGMRAERFPGTYGPYTISAPIDPANSFLGTPAVYYSEIDGVPMVAYSILNDRVCKETSS